MSSENKLKQIVEAALLAAGGPLNLDAIVELFLEEEKPEKKDLREVIAELQADYEGRGMELVEVSGGFRINVRSTYAPWVSRLWEERPPRYSRALLETLALVAYRQPITRGEIEDIRGVSVSTNIMKTLLEREWVRVVGQRDVPGKPSLYATTREFLNYFGLKSLDELPTLQEIRDLDSINQELVFEEEEKPASTPQAEEQNAEADFDQSEIAVDVSLPEAVDDQDSGEENSTSETEAETTNDLESEQTNIDVSEIDDSDASMEEASPEELKDE